MGWFGGNSVKREAVQWIPLNAVEQLDEIMNNSGKSVIFKHSTRCSISTMALSRMNNGWDAGPESVKMYLLDLLKHRDVSDAIAERFHVIHESPQIIVIDNGKMSYHTSHNDINPSTLKKKL